MHDCSLKDFESVMEKLASWMVANGFTIEKSPMNFDDLLSELSSQVKDLRGKAEREEWYPN